MIMMMIVTSCVQLSRFGWMYEEDVDVLSAVAIPTGKIRDVYGEVEDNHDSKAGLSTTEQSNLFLLGIAITAVLILAVVLYLHLRLRQEYSLYEKDKVCCVLVCCRCLCGGYTHNATIFVIRWR